MIKQALEQILCTVTLIMLMDTGKDTGAKLTIFEGQTQQLFQMSGLDWS